MAKRSREDSPAASAVVLPSPPSTLSSAEPGSSPASAAIDDSRSTKYLQVSADEPAEREPVAMKCSLAPHTETITFPTFSDFEVHYAQAHTNRCSSCYKNFPTTHFLDLHISENHDPLIAARRARDEKTYRCFVEGCDKVCSTPQKRKMHLQAKHFFPKDYDFFIVNDGIDKRSSMLRTRHRRASSAASRALQRAPTNGGAKDPHPPSTDMGRAAGSEGTHIRFQSPQNSPQENVSPSPSSEPRSPEMDDLTSTMSALKFVPPSVRFGRGLKRPADLARY